MDLVAIGDFWLSSLAWVAGLTVAFAILARLMPCNPGMYWWKDLRGAGTDLLYWFVVPLFMRMARMMMLIAGVTLLCGGTAPERAPLKDLPLWQQCLAILLIQDVMLYWIHRAFHTRFAWSFHAIHHSPRVLDWLANVRFHPLNNLLAFSLADIAVLLLGFSPAALLLLTPFNIIYSALVHANLNWTFGPLKYVFASPVFHRWHHTTEDEGLNKNFASTFPILDVIFGTFYMPTGKRPARFGNGEADFPEDLWGQLLHPFRRKGAAPALPTPPKALPEWSRRRSSADVFRIVSLLAIVSLVSGGMYVVGRLARRDEQQAREVEQAELARRQGVIARHEIPSDLVPARAVLSVAISADGGRIVSGSYDGTLELWDAATGKEKLTLKGHTRPIHSVAISADGKRVVSGSYDRTVRVWDSDARKEKHVLAGHASFVLGVAISGDGRRIASASADGTVRLWDAVTGREQRILKRDMFAVLSVALSADGGSLASASSGIAKVWAPETGQEKCVLKGHTNLVYSVAISPDGKRIVTGSFDKTVKVWDADTGKEKLALTGHGDAIYSVAISGDGKYIVSGSKDKTVKVWDAVTGQELLTFTGHTGPVNSVAISADGQRIVSGSQDGTLRVWAGPKSGLQNQTARSAVRAQPLAAP